jgi:hypothetical protein
MVEIRNAYAILIGKPEAKRPLRRHRHRWKDNNKMDLQEIGWMWISFMAQDRDRWRAFVNTVMSFWVS